jgi:hypothetical protein
VGATARITDELRVVDGEWLVQRHDIDVDPGMFAAVERTGTLGGTELGRP